MAREIPALFDDAVLAEAGSRLVRLGETFAAVGDELEWRWSATASTASTSSRWPAGMLCIVVAGPVNMPALRMAANLVARRIAPAVARAQLEPPPLPDADALASPR